MTSSDTCTWRTTDWRSGKSSTGITGSMASGLVGPPVPWRRRRSVSRSTGAEAEGQPEAVELAHGEGERARRADGVHRGHHEEGAGDGSGLPVDRDLPLGHGLEEGRLGAGRDPVDLVHQDHVGHQRTGPEGPGAVVLTVHRCAGEIGGEEVGGALDPPELGPLHGPGQGGAKRRLAHPWEIVEQEVLAGQQGRRRQPDLGRLAEQDGAESLLDRLHGDDDALVDLDRGSDTHSCSFRRPGRPP